MAAQMCFAASLRGVSPESASVVQRQQTPSQDRFETSQDDTTADRCCNGAFTPYPLRTGVGRRHSFKRAEHRGSISPTGQYIRRSIYSSEEDAGLKPRTQEGRSFSTSPSSRGTGPSRTFTSSGLDRPPKDASPLRTVSSGPAPSGTEEKKRGGNRLRHGMVTNQRDLTTVKSELRRPASPYVVTTSDASADKRKISHLERPRTHDGRVGSRLVDVSPAVSTPSNAAQSVPPSSRTHHVSVRFRHRDPSPRATEQKTGEAELPRVEQRGPFLAEPLKKGVPGSAVDIEKFRRGQEFERLSQGRIAQCAHVSSPLRGKGSDLPRVSPEAMIPEGEKRRFRAAWKEALGQLAARMDAWVEMLPPEVQRQVTEASGVDAKFLALRDCALALCRAAEVRALGLSEVQKNNDEFTRSLKREQRNAENMIVEARGKMLAASEKVKQLQRLVRITTAHAWPPRPPEESNCLTFTTGEERPLQQGCYTSYASVYPSEMHSPSPEGECYPALIDSHNAFSEAADDKYSVCSACPATAGSNSSLRDGGTRQVSGEPIPGSGGGRITASVLASATPPATPRLLSPVLETSTPASTRSCKEPDTQKAPAGTSAPNSFSQGPCSIFIGQPPPASTGCAASFPDVAPAGGVLNEDVSWASDFIAKWQSRRK